MTQHFLIFSQLVQLLNVSKQWKWSFSGQLMCVWCEVFTYNWSWHLIQWDLDTQEKWHSIVSLVHNSLQWLSVWHLWHVDLLFSAIRQGEDRRDLLEKTLLKLRVDQKGNRSTIWNICDDYAQKQDNKRRENTQAVSVANALLIIEIDFWNGSVFKKEHF